MKLFFRMVLLCFHLYFFVPSLLSLVEFPLMLFLFSLSFSRYLSISVILLAVVAAPVPSLLMIIVFVACFGSVLRLAV